MKQNSLDVTKHTTSSSSTSSLSDHHHHVSFDEHVPFKGRVDEIAVAQRTLRARERKHESFLDEFCDSMSDNKSAFSHSHTATTTLTKIKKLELASPAIFSDTASSNQTKTTHYSHHNGKSNGRGKPTLEPKKKAELLATLKHMDNDSSEH